MVNVLRSTGYRLSATFLLFAVTAAGLLFLVHTAYADQFNWLSQDTPAVASRDATLPSQDSCTNQTITIVDGYAWPTPTKKQREVCVVQGKTLRMASFQTESGMRLAIGYGSDQNMYVTNIGHPTWWRLLPGMDMAVEYVYNQGITVYKDLHRSFTIATDSSPGYPKYELNTTDPATYYILRERTSGGQRAGVYGYGVSHNGRYLGMQTVAGYSILDLSTFKVRMIDQGNYLSSSQSHQYNLTVSDDGRYLAGGVSYTLRIWDTSGGCGVPDNDMVEFTTYVSCPSRYIITQEPVNDNTEFLNYAFNDDNGQLNFYSEKDGSYHYVTVTAPGYTPVDTIDYLAMGDSISSGEGDTEVDPATGKKYYREYTDNDQDDIHEPPLPREKCHISTRSYPYYLAGWASQGVGSGKWGDVACSGAKTTDVYNGGGYGFLYNGQEKGGLPFALDKNNPRLEGYTNKDLLQTAALNEFIPGRAEQIQFVEKYKPKVITLTMGANDVGFGDKIRDCIAPGICDWAGSRKYSLASQIQNEYSHLVDLYKKLHEMVGDRVKIYALSYPQLITDDEPAHCDINTGSLYLEERQMIVQAINYFNIIIEHAANAAGVKYVDISDAFTGGKLCDDGQKYMTGVAAQGNSEIQESFHPNDYGHIKIVQKIRSQLDDRNMFDYDICGDGHVVTNCPKTGSDADQPPVPSYFGTESTKSQNVQAMPSSPVKNTETNLVINNSTLQPGSTLQATLHSDPVDLGTFTVNSDGGLNSTVTIPSSVPAGYHTLILMGRTYSGEPIELTQTVLVRGSSSDDLDENGIVDTQQPCGPFVASASVDVNGNGIDDACDPVLGHAPTNLRAALLTDANALTWTGLSGVASYNVYRDGTKIGSSSTTSYTDSTALEGGHNYFVTAQYDDYETSASNKVIVTIVKTPLAPQHLTATTPTRMPHLIWDKVTNVTSYNIYRDSIKIASSQTNSYDDATSSSGSHIYTITAVASSGESIQSNSITILVDRTAPTLGDVSLSGTGYLSVPILSLSIVVRGTAPTLSVTASDGGSGVTSGGYYLDTDPGAGHGKLMTYAVGKLTVPLQTNNTTLGYHCLYVRARDTAGNWSKVVKKTVIYL